jgi:energy-coupling factor transport system permease protein
MTTTETRSSTARTLRWRVVDIVVASVVAVACGVLFIVWIPVSSLFGDALQVAVPGGQGLLNGPWLIAGPLAAIIVRKPGAALYAEFVAAALELLVPAYGASVLLSGLVQGLGAELVFAVLLYRSWGLVPAALSGAVSGLAGSALLDIWTWYVGYDLPFKLVYVATTAISGAVIGLLCVPLVRAIAATGALDRFASGRGTRRLV